MSGARRKLDTSGRGHGYEETDKLRPIAENQSAKWIHG